ncbi:MAG: ATPase [Ruminococcus sp.]|nr:ATPase [Ruminococcus sp.]
MSDEKFFLGSSTPNGFATPVSELVNDTSNTVFILKGTAGSGKSTIMKKIRDAFPESPKEIYYCSADPYSLDAVYLKDRKALIIDGTDPHCFDPVYPKAVQSIVDLGAYLETGKLRSQKDEIIAIINEYSGYHKRCRLCLSAISSVLPDITSAACEAVDHKKLYAFTERTCRRLIPKKAEKKTDGKISYRQLSALTFDGYSTFIPDDLKIYLLNDEYISGADIFLKKAADFAVKKGYNVYISECLICTARYCEHIIIPELGIAFMTSSCINPLNIENGKKVINFRRFYKSSEFDSRPVLKQRIKFGKKAVAELINEASSELKTAKSVHDRIEEYYIAAADFDSLNRLTYKLISEIKSL